MRKINKFVIILLCVSFSCVFFASNVFALSQTNSSADVVIGQESFGACNIAPNQGDYQRGLNSPASSVVVGGKLILSDLSNNRVLIYNSVPTSDNAKPDVVIGQSGLCNIIANQGSSTPSANTLSSPRSVYSDGTKLFIVDSGNNRVLVYNSIPTSNNADADVVIGQQNFTSNSYNQGGTVNSNTLNSPRGVFVAGGKLLVSDANNHRILIFDSIPSSNNASADTVIGQADMTHNTANQGSRNSNTLSSPGEAYYDGSKLFIADSGNHRVLIFNSIPIANNVSANVVVGQTSFTLGSANRGGSVGANTLSTPYGVYSNGTKLFITDVNNHRVVIFNSIPVANNASADIAVGQADLTHNTYNQGGTVAANTLRSPWSVASDGTKLYIADANNSRLLIFNSIPGSSNANADVAVGQTDLIHGDQEQNYAAAANALYGPVGIFHYEDNFFVADPNNNRVLIYNSIPTSNNASAAVVIGQQDMTHNSSNQGGTVAANTLKSPYAVFYDGSKLFIVDTGNNRILIYNSIPTSDNASANVVIGQADMDHGSANQGGAVNGNKLSGPYGIYSTGSKLFIADTGNNRVLIYNSIPASNDASANIVMGQADMIHNSTNQGLSVGANTLKNPGSVFLSGDKMFVSDENNHRVLIFNSLPISDNANADVVIGQADMIHGSANQGGSVAANTLSGPRVVYSDNTRLFISDTSNQRLLVYNSIPTSNNAAADVVLGQSSLAVNDKNQGGSASDRTLYTPRGIDKKNNQLFIADNSNNRVLIYNLGTRAESLSASSATNSREVSLNLSATDTKDMMISENSDFSGASWETYATTKNFTLSEGDGTKTVYAKFRDFANFEGSAVSRQMSLDSTSPTVSESLSGSVFPPGTASKELTLATTENSTCKYSTDQNDSYAQMTAFSSTGGTNHSTTVSNLADGTSYVYYIKCQDSLLNTKDYQISFSLASSAYAPIIAVGEHKIYNLSPQETVALKVNSLFFRGKLTNLKGGRVQVFEDGNLKKQEKINKNGRWRVEIRREHQAEQHAYQFKYFNSQNQEVLVSNTYNILIDKIDPRFTYLPKRIQANPGDMITWQVSDNDQIKSYQYTFRGKKINTVDNFFVLPTDLPKGQSNLAVRAYDRAGNKAVRRVKVRVR